MGETVLTRIQAGLETTRGTTVVATRRVYGKLEPHRDQPRRYAMEDRGMFPDKMRANAKLVDAAFKLSADVTPEDLPWWLDMTLKGGMTGVQLGTTGVYSWACVPDQLTDTLKTRTFEWGDDSLTYRGSFGTADSLDIKVPLDDAVEMTVNGFVEEWVPVGSEGFAGFTAALPERPVESMIGWQQRLFVDLASGVIGTTQISNRFVSADLSWKNQNKRKYFGDGSPRFTLLGRGRRQIQANIVVEAMDLALANDMWATNQKQNTQLPIERAVRVMLIGTATGTALGTTTAAPIAAGTVAAIPTVALAQAIAGGTAIQLGGVTFVVAPAGAASSAVSIPVISQVIGAAIPLSSTILACKSITCDYWGFWDGNPDWANRETNRTFGLSLIGVYDVTQAKENQIVIVNSLATAAGIS